MDSRIPLSPGTKIIVNGNNYIIDDVLGCGATCLVYNAKNAEQQGRVIIKELYPFGTQIKRSGSELIWTGSDAKKKHDGDIENFRKNCNMLLDLKDKEGLTNFTSTVLGFSEENNTIYLVTDIKEGQTYEQFVRSENRSLIDIIYPIYVLSVLISAYHNYGYLHLDLKPSNFYVLTMKDRAHSINLFDVDSVINKSQIDELVGLTYSQQWAAPELIQKKYDDIDERTDFYGIGACLFYGCMGRPPEIEDIVTFHREFNFEDAEAPKCVVEANSRIKEQLKGIFEHTIRVWMGNRYESADDLTYELEKLLKSLIQDSDGGNLTEDIQKLKKWLDNIENRLSNVEDKQDQIIDKIDGQSRDLSTIKKIGLASVAILVCIMLLNNLITDLRIKEIRREYDEALKNGNVSEFELNEMAHNLDVLEGEQNPIEEPIKEDIIDYEKVINKKDIIVDLKVRPEGEKKWRSKIEAGIHDTVQWQITGINMHEDKVNDVMVRVVLPTNAMYVPGSTILYNSNYQDGVRLSDNTLTTKGIIIGSYNPRGNFYVRFSTVICDNTLASGTNKLVNWANITFDEEYNIDCAMVEVYKE